MVLYYPKEYEMMNVKFCCTAFVNHRATFLYSTLDFLWQIQYYFIFDPPTQSTISVITGHIIFVIASGL